MRRLKTLSTHTPQVVEESLKDTLKDLSGYALLGLMCLQHETEEKEPYTPTVEEVREWFKKNPPKVVSGYSSNPNSAIFKPWVEQQEWVEKKPKYADLDDE